MSNDKQINEPSYSVCLNYFGIKQNKYDIDLIEVARYKKQKEVPNDNSLEVNYQTVLKFTLANMGNNKIKNGDGIIVDGKISDEYFDEYKNGFLTAFERKYLDVPESYKNREQLNNSLKAIKEIVNTSKGKIEESNSSNIREIINEFYTNYSNQATNFINDYYNELMTANSKKSYLIDYVRNNNIENVLNESLNKLLDNELLKLLLNNEKALRDKINNLFQTICFQYQDDSIENVIIPFNKKIDEFVDKLYKEILEDTSNLILLNENDINNKYNEIEQKVNSRFNILNDDMKDTLKRVLKDLVAKSPTDVPKKELQDKLNFATTFENYQEVYSILEKAENEKELSVVSVKR